LNRLRFRSVLACIAALAIAMGVVACGGSDRSDEKPQEVLDTATLQGVDSGNIDLSLKANAPGKEGGNLNLTVSGPFQGEAKGDLPQLDITGKATGTVNGSDIDFEGGAVLLPNSAYVNFDGTEYEVDPTTFSFVESLLRPEKKAGAKKGSGTACGEAAGKLQVGELFEDSRNEGSADVGGTETTKVSGDLNVSGAVDALLEVIEDPACKAQLSAAGESIPPAAEIRAAEGQLDKGIKRAHVDVYVGDDDIVRRIAAQIDAEPEGKGSGPKSVSIDFDLQLTGVNEEQEITPPPNPKPLSDLFLKLGVNPLELLYLVNGEGSEEARSNLFEALSKAALGPESEKGGSGGGSEGGRQVYLKCIGKAKTPVDLQKCTGLLQ
jgi:hypothetical protein